jgi:hypothetical protein
LAAAVAATVVALPAEAVAGPTLAVDLAAPRHAISPDIYGMNFADEALARELRLPVRRWGGNATTRYDFRTDTTNRGSDWYFENVPGSADPANLPAGSETNAFVEQDRRTGTSTILSVPLIGWIPKGRDSSCGFSIAKYGPQQGSDAQWRPDCGNGVKPDGTNVTGNDPHDTSVEAGAAYVTDWVNYLKQTYGTAANGGVRYYNLDNEADIWHATHRDVHPAGASYDEMYTKTVAIARAVKNADPSAQTLGPVGWGWNSLLFSGADQQTCSIQGGSCWSNPPDRAAHGGVDFAAWYLKRMRDYELSLGVPVRILDYFDNHWYPQGSGVAFGSGNDPTTNALRLRSTRNLWDPTYVDESWINTATQLIPRMKSLVAANYPGTKTAITEYNWGALDHINGALAQADVLGIFGREGLDLATLWAPPTASQPGAYAFRMFLNYDGQGGRVGSQSVRATSSDQEKLAIYATQTPGQPLKFVVINKTADELTSTITATGGAPGGASAQVYRYSAANLGGIVRGADLPISLPTTGTGFLLPGTFPANSITTLVVGGADTTPPTMTGPPTVSGINSTGFTVRWPAATDNVGVTGYRIQLGGDVSRNVDVGTVLSHTFTDLTPGGRYSVGVGARDAAGNWSAFLAQPVLIILPSPPPTSSPPTSGPPTSGPPTSGPPTSNPPTSGPPPTSGCVATYRVIGQWPGGFQAEVRVQNAGGTPFRAWTVTWTFANGQRVTQLWNGSWSQSGATVTVRNLTWNGAIPPGGSQTFGFLGSYSGSNPAPTPTCTATT